MLKAEIFRLIKSPLLKIILTFNLLFTFFGFWVFKSEGLDITFLFENFHDEYYLLFLVTTFLLGSNIWADEYEYHVKDNIVIVKMLWIKLFICIIFIILYYFLCLIITYIFSIFIFGITQLNVINILKDYLLYLKMFPFYVFYFLLNMIFFLIIKKSTYSILTSYLIMLGTKFLKNKYLVWQHYNLNIPCDTSSVYRTFVLVITFLIMLLIIYFLLKKER